MVTSVPYQLRSSQIAREREEREEDPRPRRRPAQRTRARDGRDADVPDHP
jgi:hypothetical protein